MLDPAGTCAGGAGHRRLYKDLLDERGAWHQRIAATLFHQGVPGIGSMAHRAGPGRGRRGGPVGGRAAGGRDRAAQIDRLTGELDPLRRQLDMLSAASPAAGRCAPPSSASGR